ncbi:putative bifunctional diguanylate cyclase/phosphodiesterase [Dactylosporangium sp. CS-033363]|uniref:putative bifunctional diguanylate cyclase/phosphodiesterase n=1 Tax=Dactylosporangium sp. CS-033363 TaxID=3239935 RepID=UPI003D8F4B53
MVGYGVWSLVLLALYVVMPEDALGAMWIAVTASAVVAILLGVRRHKPRRRWPWRLLALNYTTFLTGSVLGLLYGGSPSIGDWWNLVVSTPVLVLALWGLSREGTSVRDRAGAIDAVIVTTAVGFLFWVYLVNPNLRDDQLGVLAKVVAIGYPVVDLATLALLARLVLTVPRSPSVAMLLLSIGSLLAGDVIFALRRLNADWTVGSAVDLLWVVFFLAGGAAALHPAMTRLTEPRVAGRASVQYRRGILGLASLIAPAVLFVQAVTGPVRDGVVVAVVSGALVLLALGRVSTVVTGLRHSMAREGELRRACEELLSTADEGQVRAVVHRAVGRLLEEGTPHRIVLSLGRVEQHGSLVYVRDLPEPLRTGLSDHELALFSPLCVGDRDLGELYVAAAEPVLLDLQEAVPVLAGQAASMLDRIALNREINHLERLYLDPLTGLGNRLRFTDALHEQPATVLVLNLDDFGPLNDAMGQEVGDQLLVAVAERLRGIDGDETLARLNADEFAMTVPDDATAARTLDALAAPFVIDGSVLRVTASIGVGADLDQARIAMLAAKREGKGRWRRYEAELHAQVAARRQLRGQLEGAIEAGQFLLHFQPIVELASGRTAGFEALVRWHHPQRGMIPPVQFIELAEETGAIVRLGAWVLDKAVQTVAGWPEVYASVNVSVRQFRTTGFVDVVLATLARHGLPPERLYLEITESLLLGEQDEITSDISRLRAAGIRISIDDFGTGYSSLSYLHRVPVDTLKLDKSFVDTIAVSDKQRALVRGIVQLAETLQMSVVAEGVETPADDELLRDMGCRYGQGYLYARPLPEADAGAFLQKVADGAGDR